MKHLLKFCLIWLLFHLIIATPAGYAQGGNEPQSPGLEPAFRFSHLTTADGLANNRIESILQDSRGFMWFATEDGLSRYDGYNFVTYQHDPNDPNSLASNRIAGIVEDDLGRLWIATAPSGLSLFDPNSERMRRILPDPAQPNNPSSGIRSLLRDSQGRIWLGTQSDGLLQIAPPLIPSASDALTVGAMTAYPVPTSGPHQFGAGVLQMIEDQTGSLWLAAGDSLVKFDSDTAQYTRYVPPDPSAEISTVLQDEAGQIWLDGADLYKFDPVLERFTTYPVPRGERRIRQLLADQRGNLWMATLGGLFRFDLERERFTNIYQHNPVEPTSLNSDRTFSLYQDRAGLIWIGTDNAGLNLLDLRQSQFDTYRHDPANPASLGQSRVTDIVGDETGLLWVGTDTILNRLNLEEGQISHYPLENALPGPVGIIALYQDRTGLLWFGLNNLLLSFDAASETFTPFEVEAGDARRQGPPNPITAIYEDHFGSIWIGRERSGFFHFDRSSSQFRPVRLKPTEVGGPAASIRAIYEVSAEEVWLAGPGTLVRFNPRTEDVVYYQAPFEQSSTLYQDKHGHIWIAAFNGLFRFEPGASSEQPGNFTRYTDQNGLPSNAVMAMLVDGEGNLWLSTKNGLSRFDPESETFHTYTVEDGLQGNEFIAGSAWQAPDGRMYFGGQQGLTTFYPDQIEDDAYQPPVVLTEARLFNEPLTLDPESSLDQAIPAAKQLTFSYDQDVISFEFAALSYAAPHKNRYRYKLEGFDHDWNEVSSDRRFATYTSLPAGDYLFRVQATNQNGLWSEHEAILALTIMPPWWETLWFRAFILVMVVGLVVGAIRWRTHLIRVQNRQLEAQVLERTKELAAAKDAADQANRAKSTFLANMSHELRSPLNAILGFTQITRRQATVDASTRENLNIIMQSGEHLLNVINQVLDLSKIEAGQITLNAAEFNLHQLLVYLEDMFALKADEKRLQLRFDIADNVPQYIRTDEVKLRQVLINLLNNALKFTKQGGVHLYVKVSDQNENEPGRNVLPLPEEVQLKETKTIAPRPAVGPKARITFSVTDSGPGIASDEMNALFEAFAQTASGRQSQEGTGLGLPISRKFVQLMGGELTAHSPAQTPSSTVGGPGATFLFDIEVEPGTGLFERQRRDMQAVIGLKPGQPQYRVLVVDDIWANRQLLVKLLVPLGFDVQQAENGQEAIEIWQSWRPHLILMDMRMPVMNGYEATPIIKARASQQNADQKSKHPQPIIIAVTASSFEEERASVLQIGCDDYIRKPFQTDELLALIQSHLDLAFITTEFEAGPLSEPQNELSALDLTLLSPELLDRFEQAVDLLDVELMGRIIDEIGASQSEIADRLRDLTYNFQYSQLQSLIEEARANAASTAG